MSKETKVKVWWYNLFPNLPKPVLDTLNRIFHVFALDPVHSYFLTAEVPLQFLFALSYIVATCC